MAKRNGGNYIWLSNQHIHGFPKNLVNTLMVDVQLFYLDSLWGGRGNLSHHALTGEGFTVKMIFSTKTFGTVVFQVSNFSFIFRCLHSRQRKEPLREYEEKLRTRWVRSDDFSNIAVLVQQKKWIYSLSSLALSGMIYHLLENYQMILCVNLFILLAFRPRKSEKEERVCRRFGEKVGSQVRYKEGKFAFCPPGEGEGTLQAPPPQPHQRFNPFI